MLLKGSCHCGAVTFSLQSQYPVPYQRCYCEICRKTTGGGGYAINISGDAASLEVTGRKNVKVYQATIEKEGAVTQSDHERHFCRECGSHLWAYNGNWPELIHPLASALDTELPLPTENVHMMLAARAPWVCIEGGAEDSRFDAYPKESIAALHDRLKWTV